MRAYLPFIIAGITTGSVYAIASLGLVLTYRTSGVFNFAHGAIGMFATYVFYSLRPHVPTAVAALIAALVVAPAMGIVIDRLLLRRLQGSGSATYVVASLGLLVLLQGAVVAIWGAETRRVAALFPRDAYRVFDINVGIDQTIVVGVAIAASLGLIMFFRRTHLGLQSRAVVDDRTLGSLSGTNASAVTTFSWMLGCAFAATSGILFVPFVGLDSLLLTLLVAEAFGAAAVGRLRSFPVTALAAFGVGVAQSVLTKIIGDLNAPSLAGLPSAVPFTVLTLALLFYRPGSFQEVVTETKLGVVQRRGAARGERMPVRPMLFFFAVAVGLGPLVSGSRLLTFTATAAFLLLFMSLSLLIGLSRQVSLAHTVFVVFGATTLSHLLSAGLPYLVALPLAALVLVPVGALMAIPAIRLSGLFLALVTFGFGILAQNLLFNTGIAFGLDSIVNISRPGFLASDLSFFYFTLAVVVAGVVSVEILRVSRLGRILIALGDAPTAVQSLGVSPLVARVLCFCLSAFLAALAGGLLGSLTQVVTVQSFHAYLSLVWVAVLVAAGPKTFGGAVLAAVALVTVPGMVTSSLLTTWQPILFGAGAILLAQANNGLVGMIRMPDFGASGGEVAERVAARQRRAVERLRRQGRVDDRLASGSAG